MNIKLLIPAFAFLISLAGYTGCASSEEQSKEKVQAKPDSVYVFDEVPKDSGAVKKEIPPVVKSSVVSGKQTVYYVQVGMFSTPEKANEFVSGAGKELNKQFKVFQNKEKTGYTVWVTPSFGAKADAELYRDEIRKKKEFKDAWVVSASE